MRHQRYYNLRQVLQITKNSYYNPRPLVQINKSREWLCVTASLPISYQKTTGSWSAGGRWDRLWGIRIVTSEILQSPVLSLEQPINKIILFPLRRSFARHPPADQEAWGLWVRGCQFQNCSSKNHHLCGIYLSSLIYARLCISSFFFFTQNICHGSLCQPVKDTICQVGFTNKGYRCVCREGYTGSQCEGNYISSVQQ